MKIGREIATKNVPAGKTASKTRNSAYDELASKISFLKSGKSLPVECEDKREVANLCAAMRQRMNKAVKCEVRGLTIYFSLKA